MHYRFECTNQEGAVLILKNHATKSSIGLNLPFEKYMLRNHDSWYNFAVDSGVGLDPQDIILVRGAVKSSSWAVAAFFDASQQKHEVTFNGQFGDLAGVGVGFSQQHDVFCSFEQRVGPHARPSNSKIGRAHV